VAAAGRSGWMWIGLVVAGLAAAVLCRWRAGPPTEPASAGGSVGLVGAEAGRPPDLLARVGRLEAEAAQVESRRRTLCHQARERRRWARVLDEMVESGRLSDAPDFLRGQTTILALQRIIRMASAGGPAGGRADPRFQTAAAVAQSRLRGKLTALAERFRAEAEDFERQAAALETEARLKREAAAAIRRRLAEDKSPPTDTGRSGGASPRPGAGSGFGGPGP